MTQTPEYVLPNSTVTIEDIYSWTGQLASESRSRDWIDHWYIFPDAVKQIIQQLETMNGGVIALVGLQGAGKSSALLALETYLDRLQHMEAVQIAKRIARASRPPEDQHRTLSSQSRRRCSETNTSSLAR